MDKREIELIKQNIFKDRRRRYLYLSKDYTSGLQINEHELKLYSTLKSAYLIALLLFLALFAIFRQSLVLSTLLSAAIMIGASLYLKLVFLNNRNEIKLSEMDQERAHAPEFLKALESHNLTKVILPIGLGLIVFLRLLEANNPLPKLDYELARFLVLFSITYAMMYVPQYLRSRKLRKLKANPAK